MDAGSHVKSGPVESKLGDRFDTYARIKATQRLLGLAEVQRVADRLGLDPSTVYAWQQRKAHARTGEHVTRLTGPLKQLAVMTDEALANAEDEDQVDDAFAGIYWLGSEFGLNVSVRKPIGEESDEDVILSAARAATQAADVALKLTGVALDEEHVAELQRVNRLLHQAQERVSAALDRRAFSHIREIRKEGVA